MKAIVSSAMLLAVVCGITKPAMAQVVPDNTLGTQVTQTGAVFGINNGTRSGNNLFHSFSQFSIPTGSSAIFNNATDIQNIFGRVTGSQLSNIDGILKTQGSANLFLMNPNGIVFGSNAKLQLGGSFLGTTATGMKFVDRIEFNTVNSTPALLSINLPIGLQFGNNPGKIIVQESMLEVPTGKSFLLAGNNMEIIGTIKAKGGRLDFASISGAGEVAIESDPFQNLTLRVPDTTPRGNLQAGADLSTHKHTEFIVANPRGGSVGITARNFNFLGDTTIDAGVTGIGSLNQKSGDVEINVQERFYIDYAIAVSRINRKSIGNAGDITIIAGEMIAVNGAQFSASNRGNGTGGNINITTKNGIDFSGQDRDGYQTSLFSSVRSGAVGNSGKVVLNARSVSFTNGAALTLVTEGNGNAGTIEINAKDSVTFRGGGVRPDIDGKKVTSGIFSNVEEAGIGNGGSIKLTAPNVFIADGATLLTSNKGKGDAGNINIMADVLSLDHGASLGSESFSGSQGNIIIQTKDATILRHGSLITTNAGGNASGGNITIDSPIIIGLENSDISANAIKGKGGNVKINTQSIWGLQYRDRLTSDNDITASSEFGINGNVQINTIGIDPANALNTLPSEVVDSSRQIADRCGAARTSSFIATGRGGMPQNPIKQRRTDRSWHDLRPITAKTPSTIQPIVTANPIQPLVEASAIQVDASGAIALVAAKPIGIQAAATCGMGEPR